MVKHMRLPMDELERRFRKPMKERILPEYWIEGRYDYQGCADALNNLFGFDDEQEITANGIRNFFNGDYTQRKALWIMLGLLQLHNIPYDQVFPAVAKKGLLEDEGYFQTYYGMMYPRNSALSKVEDLRFFTLAINPGNDFEPPSAILSYENKGDENRQPISRKFCGTPVLSPKNDIVSIQFHDEKPNVGTFFHFYFAYHMVNAISLRFKRGFVVTTLSDAQRSEIPVVLNFVMRDQPIDLETVQLYPGLETLLQYANSSVYVLTEEFHAVLSRYPAVSYLFNPDERLTEVTREDLCVIDEPGILEDIKKKEPNREQRQKAYRCLLELKKASRSPTHITWDALYDDLIKTIMGIQ